jgi:periplasmic protein TonB
MTTATHAIATPGRAQRRVTGFILALLLQVALVWALIVGLHIQVLPQPDHHTVITILRDHTNPPPAQPLPLNPFVEPPPVTALPPDVPISGPGERGTAITPTDNGPHGPVGAFSQAAEGIVSTHTTPPYPAMELRLGAEGVVRLHLVVSPQGFVTNAVVVRSSGYEGLDRAAHDWILAHWRYRAATRGGVPVASTADVAVQFDLKNAR